MMRLLPVCIVIVMAAVLVPGTASAAPGTGGVTINRLPWREGEGTNVQHPGQIQLTQGWFGHTSHYSQFAEDWANSGNSFLVVAATESNGQYGAECRPGSTGGGNYVKVLRPSGALTDYYFHLQDGVCNDWPLVGGIRKKHVEQGDEIGQAGDTGNADGIHLHYEPRGPGGGPADSVWHSLSGIMNFCDHDDSQVPEHDGEPDYTCSQNHHNEWYTSDNVGPGVGDGIPAWTAGAIWLAYSGLGHYLCGGSGKAWDCFGSSYNVFGEGRKAGDGCLGTPQDCGWAQDFREQNSSGGEHHGFGKPNGCASAYWGPDGFFVAWLNNMDLGYPRTNIYYEPTAPMGLPTGAGWYQWFRHGYLYSAVTTSASPYYNTQRTTCG